MTTADCDLDRFQDLQDLRSYYKDLSLDGIELLEFGEDLQGKIEPSDVIGVHLKYFTAWMGLWLGDSERLLNEFDDWSTVQEIYGGQSKQVLIDSMKKNLAFAGSLEPEYLVFHVSECTIAETMLRKYHYTNEEVVDAAIEWINTFVSDIKGTPWLLFENLWHSGLTMLDPELTSRILEEVNYKYKGVMLDIGHLLHTNPQLSNLDEAILYIEQVLDLYDDLDFIKGVHLHQTLSGSYSLNLKNTWQPCTEPHETRLFESLLHVYKIDSHKPFVHNRVKELIQRIAPDYLVFEQISSTREEHLEQLIAQLNCF